MMFQSLAIATLLQASHLVIVAASETMEGLHFSRSDIASSRINRKRAGGAQHKSIQEQRRIQRVKEEAYDPYLGLEHRRMDEEVEEGPMPTVEPDTPISCEFCPDGLTVDSDFALPSNDGSTCTTAMEFAATISPDDAICSTVQLAQGICCPGEPTTLPETETTTTVATIQSPDTTTIATEIPDTTTAATIEDTTTPPNYIIFTEPPEHEIPDTTTAATIEDTTTPPNYIIFTEPPEQDMSMHLSAKSVKSGKHGKAKKEPSAKATKTHKESNPMAKVHKEMSISKSSKSVPLDAKSGKALVNVDAKAEKVSSNTEYESKTSKMFKKGSDDANMSMHTASKGSGKSGKGSVEKASKNGSSKDSSATTTTTRLLKNDVW